MLAALASLLLMALTSCSGGVSVAESATPSGGGTGRGQGTAQAENRVPSRAAFLDPQGDYFGVSTLSTPDEKETAAVAEAAGRHPTLLEYFVKWSQDFEPDVVRQCYQEGALPVLTWEPSDGSKSLNQPAYSLARIADGAFDPYLVKFATAVRDQKYPLVLRFAHEMNGNWTPWYEGNSGNHPGDFVRAWRHVHDVFSYVGATNVIWLWSPNILRGASSTDLGELYPGDSYVDWAGVDAYGFGERTADEVLAPTIAAVQKLTAKPILIAETGAKPGAEQPGWTASLFAWLRRNPEVIGFIWFQHSVAEGGRFDYRFNIDPKTLAAFRSGLASLRLAHWPVAG